MRRTISTTQTTACRRPCNSCLPGQDQLRRRRRCRPSLVDGLQASATALTQSAKNASEGVGLLQVADGALSQVTSLLNRAVTLATEASNGTISGAQITAANAEYTNILGENNQHQYEHGVQRHQILWDNIRHLHDRWNDKPNGQRHSPRQRRCDYARTDGRRIHHSGNSTD